MPSPRICRSDVEAVLLDIEGTLGPISFVRDVLFPYARQRLADYVEANRDTAVVANILEQASQLSGGEEPLAALMRWHDADQKITPLKTLQGLIWQEGYRNGAFRSPIYPDALSALKRWKQQGLPLYIYSSGSKQAQLLFFANTTDGNITDFFSGHYDTDIGAKTDPGAYTRIAQNLSVRPDRIIFFSDQVKELDAAQIAGLGSVHVAKDETPRSEAHTEITDYARIELISSLPEMVAVSN